MRTRYLIGAFMVVAMFALFFHGISFLESRLFEEKPQLKKIRSIAPALVAAWDLPKPRERRTQSPSERVSGKNALEIAQAYIKAHARDLNLQPHHELQPRVFESPLSTRVQYRVFEDGLLVEGISLTLDIRHGRVDNVENNYRPLKKANLSEAAPLDEILEKLSSHRTLVVDGEGEESVSTLLYADALKETPTLAYAVSMRDSKNPERQYQVLVRASDGQILRRTVSRAEFQ